MERTSDFALRAVPQQRLHLGTVRTGAVAVFASARVHQQRLKQGKQKVRQEFYQFVCTVRGTKVVVEGDEHDEHEHTMNTQ